MSDAFRTHDGRTLERAASDLVAREVHLCLSSMVSTLAANWDVDHVNDGMNELHEQAQELCAPVLDYEESAREAGWSQVPGATASAPMMFWHEGERRRELYASWDALCAEENIEPHEWEVYEHWAISTWLAAKLLAEGERVEPDFAGLNVWARTTTGQAISIDAVIERIVRELHAPSADAAN